MKMGIVSFFLCAFLFSCSNFEAIKERIPASENCQEIATSLIMGSKKNENLNGGSILVVSRMNIFEAILFDLAPKEKIIGKMSLSPDGKFIVIRTNVKKDGLEKSVHHYVVDIEKRKLTGVVKSSYKGDFSSELDRVTWSPDSSRFLFTSGNQMRMGVHDIESGLSKHVVNTYNTPVKNYVWSPDGRSMALIDESKRSISIYDMNLLSPNFSLIVNKHSSNDFESYTDLNWENHYTINVVSSNDLGDRAWYLGANKFSIVPKKPSKISEPGIFTNENYHIKQTTKNIFIIKNLKNQKEFTLNLNDIAGDSKSIVSDIIASDQRVLIMFKNGDFMTVEIPENP